MDQPIVKVTRDAIKRVIELLGDDEDERLRLDSLEAETPLFDLVQLLLDGVEADEGAFHALSAQINTRETRMQRIEKRIDERKAIIASLMQEAGVTKIPLPEATVFTSNRPAGFKVLDVDALPEGLFTEETKVTRKADKPAIEAALEDGDVPGVTRTNGQVTLSIRRK